jgi:hypothetical protein
VIFCMEMVIEHAYNYCMKHCCIVKIVEMEMMNGALLVH